MKPNLDKIIQDNLDKAKFQSKLKPSLPKNTGWLDGYAGGGTYISGKALATQFGQYPEGGQPGPSIKVPNKPLPKTINTLPTDNTAYKINDVEFPLKNLPLNHNENTIRGISKEEFDSAPHEDTRSVFSDSRSKERGNNVWNFTKKATTLGQYSPEPYSRGISNSLNSIMGATDAYLSYKNKDYNNATINAIGAIPIPGFKIIKSLKNIPGLTKKQKSSVMKTAFAALGIDFFGTASDLTNNFGLENKKYGGWLSKYEEGGPGDTYVAPVMPDLRHPGEGSVYQHIDRTIPLMGSTVPNNPDIVRKIEKETAAKELALRKQASQVMKQKGDTHFTFPNGDYKPYKDMNFRERSYVEGLALDQDTRLNKDEDSVLDFFNPLHQIGSLGKGLAQAPYVAKQTNSYLPYITGIGNPLLAGRMMGSGSMNPLSSKMWTNEISNKEFANILAGGIPGLIEKSAPKAISIGKTLYDIPRAESLKEAMGRVIGVPLKKDLPRLLQGEVKPLRVVQDIGRLRAKGSSVAEQMKFALENKLPEEHFQKIFDRSKEEGQNLLDTGFGEQAASNHTGNINLRRNAGQMITDDEIISALENHERQSQRNRLRDMFREIDQAESNSLPTNRDDRIVHTLDNLENSTFSTLRQPTPESIAQYREQINLQNGNRGTIRRGRTLLRGDLSDQPSLLNALKNDVKKGINNTLDKKTNNLIQEYPYYSGEVIQKVPNLHLNESEDMKKVFAKVFSAPEGIQSGDVFMGSDNTSHSSYLPQLKQVFKYTKGDPQFVGYKPMNTMGFLSKYGYEADDVAKYLNSEIDELIKRGKLPNNIQRPFLKEDHVILPQYAIKQHKYGGDISIPNLNNNWLSKYEDGSVVDYLADKNQDFSYSHRKEIAKELGIENYRGTAEQNLQMLSMLKQASQPKEETEEVEQTDVQPSVVNPFVSFDNYSFNKPDVNIAPNNYSLSSASKTPSIAELKSKLVNRTKPQEAPVKKAVPVNKVKIPEYNPFNFINKPPAIDNTRNSKIPDYDPFGFIKALPPRGPAPADEKVVEKHWYDGLKDLGKYYYDIDGNIHERITNKDYKDAFRKLTADAVGLVSKDKKIQVENYFKRSDLKNNDKLQETKTNLVIPKNVKSPDIITGDTIPLPFKNKLTDIPNRYIIPGQIDLTNTKWGYRNRGEYKDITTEGGDITLFNNLIPAKEFFKKNPNAKETDSFIGLAPDGTPLAGNKKDFINSNAIISQTFSNKIIDFPRDNNGKLLLKQSSTKASSKHLSPVINVLNDDGKTSLGSLNFLIPKNNKDANSFGDITGGRVIFKAPDGKMKLAIGSAENIAQIFDQFKKEGNYPYLTAFTNDNGTYGPGLRTKSGKITAEDLKKYQGANETGSVFMYLKPGNYNKNIETKTKFKDVQMSTPNIRTENDESFKKGHPLINQQKAVVLHHTGYSDTTGVSKGMSEAMRGVNNQFSKAGESSHVVIDFDGTRYNYAKPSQVAFHAGKSLLNGKDNVNDFGIGIEFQGDTDKKHLTDKQIESFIEYIAPIIKEKQIPLENIITHKQIRSNYIKANPKDKQVAAKPDVNEIDYQRILSALKKKKIYN